MELEQYQSEAQAALLEILQFWTVHAVDEQQGGFYGRILHDNTIFPQAAKGVVLNSRILWTFSAAYNELGRPVDLGLATRAFEAIRQHFWDREYGGVYWSIQANGAPLDQKKQFYGLAFAVYGLSEYYRAARDQDALEMAIKLYELVQVHSFDAVGGGYIEACSRNWEPIEDLRLSSKDANEKKSMNTHLHILEAFTNLYRVWPDKILKLRIREILEIFLGHIIDPVTHHLLLFFDEQWTSKSSAFSFGHDIEAAWLLMESAEVIGDRGLYDRLSKTAVNLAEAASAGLDIDGGMWNEYDPQSGHFNKEKHWWVQAEAMVGFMNAYELTGDKKYLDRSLNNWQFIKGHGKDPLGEWVWGIDEKGAVMTGEDKAGFWKCPYHNSRACLEIIRRCAASR